MAWTKLPDVTQITMETPRPLPLTLKSTDRARRRRHAGWIRDYPTSRYYARSRGTCGSSRRRALLASGLLHPERAPP